MPRKITYEEVFEAFSEAGCKLLSTEYVRAKEKLKYVCSCGNASEISYEKFSKGQRCYSCRNTKLGAQKRHSYDYVKKVFEDGGCELLSKRYLHGKEKLSYKCNCGREALITFNKFNAGQRCRFCGFESSAEKQSGSNSPNWIDGRSQDQRYKDRSYPEYKKWRRDVFYRDDFTCQYCDEKGGNIHAHHIESFANNEHLRTEISNGITLCEGCHKEYHTAFGRNNANSNDFNDFISGHYYENKVPPFAGEEDDDAYAEYCETTFG